MKVSIYIKFEIIKRTKIFLLVQILKKSTISDIRKNTIELNTATEP